MAHPSRARGFTLIETLSAVAVAAVLLAVGVPGLQEFVSKQSVMSASESFSLALQSARAESSRRGAAVSVCRLAAATDGSFGCAPATQDWSAGWLTFIDRGVVGKFEDDDEILQVHRGADAVRVEREVPARPEAVTFQPIGPVAGLAGAWEVRFAPSGTGTFARSTCLSYMGRAFTKQGTQSCQ